MNKEKIKLMRELWRENEIKNGKTKWEFQGFNFVTGCPFVVN